MSLWHPDKIALSRLKIDTSKDWLGYLIKNIGAPVDVGDALRKGTRLTMAEMPDGTLGYVLTGQGAGANPAYQPISAESHDIYQASDTTSVTLGTSLTDVVSASITINKTTDKVLIFGRASIKRGGLSSGYSDSVLTDGANNELSVRSRCWCETANDIFEVPTFAYKTGFAVGTQTIKLRALSSTGDFTATNYHILIIVIRT
jgi:hypothetical protein